MGFFDSGTDNQKTTNTPWKEQVPYLKQIFKQASMLYNKGGPKYYSGSTVAPFSQQQNMAYRLGQKRALNGNATMNNAEQYTNRVLDGAYNKDPYAGKVFKGIESKVLPSVNSMFSAAGRYGSSANQSAAAGALTDSFAPYASQMYQQGLNRQQQAVGDAFKFGDADYRDLGMLEGIGQKKQGLAQNELNDAVNRWNFYQNLPQQNLQTFQNTIQGNYGGTTNQQVNTPSMFSQLLGGGLGIGGLLLGSGLF